MNVSIFQIFKILSQISSNLKNFLKYRAIFAQNLAQNWVDWYMNGSLFLEKLVFVWVYVQILWQHVPTKTKLEYPPFPGMSEFHQYGRLSALFPTSC